MEYHTGSENVLDRIAANDYSIIHFAGHGIYDESDPGRGFVVLDSERVGQNKSAVLSIGDIRAAKSTRGGPFVFVNACYSGVIDDRYQGFVGFAGPLLERGASGCVVTLWSISNSSASKFASSFYREALEGRPVGQALRSARLQCWEEQRDILTSLAYVLFGDPNTIVTRVVDGERRT
jgi:CHAT domain-containing protein